jgi:hypothetical protein
LRCLGGDAGGKKPDGESRFSASAIPPSRHPPEVPGASPIPERLRLRRARDSPLTHSPSHMGMIAAVAGQRATALPGAPQSERPTQHRRTPFTLQLSDRAIAHANATGALKMGGRAGSGRAVSSIPPYLAPQVNNGGIVDPALPAVIPL